MGAHCAEVANRCFPVHRIPRVNNNFPFLTDPSHVSDLTAEVKSSTPTCSCHLQGNLNSSFPFTWIRLVG